MRPFFCQVEAIETVIWLSEVARRNKRYAHIWRHIEDANGDANPALLRIALKMATGAGKTTVMAMLIAWHACNHARSPGSKTFTNGFLIVAPGITIRDRLRVLQPSDPDSYYKSREIVPDDLLNDVGTARVRIVNYHAFQLKEHESTNKVSKALLDGRRPTPEKRITRETEGEMALRVAKDLPEGLVIINDEAHHCYRRRPGTEEDQLTGEAKANDEEARLWINGLEAVRRKLKAGMVYDLSATPFFLSGSGYVEGTLFPWVVSDFSLMDAIECGIVKLPRVPVADNATSRQKDALPVYRELWKHIGSKMGRRGRGTGGGTGDPNDLPDELVGALNALYGHYVKTDDEWRRAGIKVPPVFIVVCQNTAHSKLVAEYISGWSRPNEDGDEVVQNVGHLPLFRNYDKDTFEPLNKPNTFLIDSHAVEAGDAIDPAFKKAFGAQIDTFKRERRERAGAGEADPTDAELMREVMNTVGREGRLGEHVRCVVSVSMLTEGWDTNSVTHILGVRAFGTQLLCEQVVGRALRRYSYELDPAQTDADGHPLFEVEYADVLGIPFDFTAKPTVSKPRAPTPKTRIHTVEARSAYEIRFPRVSGYRIALPNEKLVATFTEASRLRIEPDMMGPSVTELEGIVGESITLTLAEARDMRPSTVAWNLAKEMLMRHFWTEGGDPKLHLMGQIRSICRRWVEGGYLECADGTAPWMLNHKPIGDRAIERIHSAIVRGMDAERHVVAVLDPFEPDGSTGHVGFDTTKSVYFVRDKCHLNAVAEDSGWEGQFARVCETHPAVMSFVKNQGLGFTIPYRDGSVMRDYVPDFIVRVDVGGAEPLNVVVEIKGQKDVSVGAKNETMETKWVPGVNALGTHGRWNFAMFEDIALIETEFTRFVDGLVAKHAPTEEAA